MKILIFLVTAFCALPSFAQVAANEITARPMGAVAPLGSPTSLTAQELYRRTEAVLHHFGAKPDAPLPSLDDLSERQRPEDLKTRLRYIDPFDTLKLFDSLKTDPQTGQSWLLGFLDRTSKTVLDYTVALRPSTAKDENLSPFELNIRAAQKNSVQQPLRGLRIALDPGHMGGTYWDNLTGKWISDGKGTKLSEGVQVLIACLLLEKRLKDLGAEVFITRRGLRPVTTLPISKLDLREYGLEELKRSTLDSWFLGLISKYPVGEALFNAVAKHAEFKRLFSESMRARYFVFAADLQARSQMIRQFKPDITLVVHMDVVTTSASDHGLHSVGANATKAFIEGHVGGYEFATRNDRRLLARHLLEPAAWPASLNLSRHVTTAISQGLRIPLDPVQINGGRQIGPGLFVRNFALTRQITDCALSYVETLFYNDTAEFYRLANRDFTMMIDGQELAYSQRLVDLVESLSTGVLNFVKAY